MGKKLLCITAHPDDETANFGGTVSRYSQQGVQCRLICLTAGEAARHRGAAKDRAELKALRRQELAAACRLLGFSEHEVWDMADAHLPEAPFYYAVGRLVAEIRRYQPEIMLTMGPEGSATGHPDHGMAGTLATTAFHWAARDIFFPEQGLAPFRCSRLYYSTVPVQPPQFPPVWLPFPDVSIPVPEFLERKIEAFRLHTTQAPLLERVVPFLRMAGEQEMFHLAAGVPLPETGRVDDLWLGL